MDSLETSTTTKDCSVLPTTNTDSTVLPTTNKDTLQPTTTSDDAPKSSTTSGYSPAITTTGRTTSRHNQWFVPADGISREVIAADIQRYLGPDAMIRPGQGVGNYAGSAGYWITAYRCLTSQMIQDLKQDSLRWASERQTDQSGRPSVAYQDSQTHAARQHWGPTTPYESKWEVRMNKGQGAGYSSSDPYSSSAAPGYYTASDGRQYPLSQQPASTTRARGYGAVASYR